MKISSKFMIFNGFVLIAYAAIFLVCSTNTTVKLLYGNCLMMIQFFYICIIFTYTLEQGAMKACTSVKKNIVKADKAITNER